jgi:hypothetical protein
VRIRNDGNQLAGEQQSNSWDIHQSTTYFRSSCAGHDPATGLQNLGAYETELIDHMVKHSRADFSTR